MLGLNGLFHDGVEAVGWFEDGRGWLRLKGASEWNGMFGAIAIVPRVEGSSLQLQSRLQVPFIPVVLLMPFAVPPLTATTSGSVSLSFTVVKSATTSGV